MLAVNGLSDISLHWTLNQYSVAVREYAISKWTTHVLQYTMMDLGLSQYIVGNF